MSSRRVVPDAHASWTAVNVRGTPGPDRISVSARHVLVRSLTGADRVRAGGRVVEVYGGRGADRLKVGGLDSTFTRGGGGPDVLRGSKGRDRLYRGLG